MTVSTIDEYVELAVRLGKDSQLRQQISKKIVANKHRIYHDRECITALEDFLESVVKQRYEQDSKETN
jgi:protein O-GlcNAc transferase